MRTILYLYIVLHMYPFNLFRAYFRRRWFSAVFIFWCSIRNANDRRLQYTHTHTYYVSTNKKIKLESCFPMQYIILQSMYNYVSALGFADGALDVVRSSDDGGGSATEIHSPLLVNWTGFDVCHTFRVLRRAIVCGMGAFDKIRAMTK